MDVCEMNYILDLSSSPDAEFKEYNKKKSICGLISLK